MALDPKSQSTQDRRDANRQRYHERITLRIADTEIIGSAENISKSGILFHTDGTLEVTVEIEDDGIVKQVPGRLVRCERIQGTKQGWAIEFGN